MDVSNLFIVYRTLDLVTAFETIYFWPNIRQSFLNVYNALKDGGKFLICNESNGKDKNSIAWSKKIKGMNLYDKTKLDELLKDVGFKTVEFDESKSPWLAVIATK